jgi:hypothetical protein
MRALVALLAVALVAVVLAGCGGSGSESSSGGSGGGGDDAQALLRQTFSGSHQVKSGRLTIALGITAQGDSSIRGPVRVAISGPFQSEGAGRLPQFDMNADLSAQGQSFQAGLTSTGSRAFVKFGGTNYAVPDQVLTQLKQSYDQQVKQSSSSGRGLGAFGIEPLRWLRDPSVRGEETVGGTATEHISASLDTARFLDDVNTLLRRANEQGLGSATGRALPRELTARERQQAMAAIRTAKVDVWTGKDDKTLRKLAVALTLADSSSGRAQTASVSFSVELADVNQPQTITAPTTSRPLQELLGQFSSLLGGSALGGGSGSSGGSSSSGSIDRYTKCLTDAGSDVAKAQKCADLLTK